MRRSSWLCALLLCRNAMESCVFAETFRYFFLLFAAPSTLDFDHVVLNTEAHPLRRF